MGFQPVYVGLSAVPEMSRADRNDLEQRIEEYHLKIEALDAFRDDPKIDKIIRALKRQIAEDSCELSLGSIDPPRSEAGISGAAKR